MFRFLRDLRLNIDLDRAPSSSDYHRAKTNSEDHPAEVGQPMMTLDPFLGLSNEKHPEHARVTSVKLV